MQGTLVKKSGSDISEFWQLSGYCYRAPFVRSLNVFSMAAPKPALLHTLHKKRPPLSGRFLLGLKSRLDPIVGENWINKRSDLPSKPILFMIKGM
ncbi:hypothetical protein AYR62_14490 [Secundilactobacillus paracollinoides]|uniref:Uncharacterized protein n=1 Tax=Secundilactobacillus paracollinoides TaxID=240427 RepID=A0A1B2IX69_9LACO|nr:hypothetical protein AYR62_14490 [Secundilactobacillus paracollinoides]ANZ66637.1 hypothetical protein AYR63_05480 [Secundilactobacillus paracollinoides]